MEDWEERLIYEEAELRIKAVKLARFIITPEFSALHKDEKEIMQDQMQAMDTYLEVLRERITRL